MRSTLELDDTPHTEQSFSNEQEDNCATACCSTAKYDDAPMYVAQLSANDENKSSDGLPSAEAIANIERAEGRPHNSSEIESPERLAFRNALMKKLPILQNSCRIEISNSPKTISDSSNMEKRACRICQSETGEMVRPCACTGTMGDIHERCLNEWLLRSNNNERCEICHEKYSKSGNILQPIWKWQKPQIDMTNIVELSSVICLSLCLWYMITLTIEREFFERVFTAGLPPRSPDIARILITLLITSTLLGGLMNTVMRIWHYIDKQRAVRFVDSEANKTVSK